jgi:hypothetical protein
MQWLCTLNRCGLTGVGDYIAPEGNIADSGGEAVLWDARGFESLVADLCGRVQVRGDRRGDCVVLDTDHDGLVGGVSDEGAAATGFEHTSTGETGLLQCLPDDAGDRGVGVVRVEHRCLGLPVLLCGEEIAQLLALGAEGVVAWVEDIGHCAPTGPGRQYGLLVGGGRSPGLAEVVEQFDRGDVGPGAGLATGGDERLCAGGEVDGGAEWTWRGSPSAS